MGDWNMSAIVRKGRGMGRKDGGAKTGDWNLSAILRKGRNMGWKEGCTITGKYGMSTIGRRGRNMGCKGCGTQAGDWATSAIGRRGRNIKRQLKMAALLEVKINIVEFLFICDYQYRQSPMPTRATASPANAPTRALSLISHKKWPGVRDTL